MLVADTRTDRTQAEAENPAAPVPDAEEPSGESPRLSDEEHTPPPPEPPLSLTASLEDRVRRLEDIIATLHLDPPGLSHPVTAHPEGLAGDGIVTAPHPGVTPIKEGTPVPLPPPARPPMYSRSDPWLLFEIYAEGRAILRMYFDPRYRMSWHSRLMIPLLIVGIVLSRMMIASVPLIGWLLDIVLFPVLLYVLIKVLSREATRYRLTSPDLPPGMRL